MTRVIPFAEGEYYHVYNRGVEKRDVFMSEGDRRRFQQLLYLSNSTRLVDFREMQRIFAERQSGTDPKLSFRAARKLSFGSLAFRDILQITERGEPVVAVGAYCMMPNHIHLLLREIKEGGISAYLQKLTTAYTKFFNKKYDRVGALFQGTFKAQHVNKDEYLKYLFAYIHLNPVKLIDPHWKENGIADRDAAEKYLDGYQWSSYADYMGVKREEAAILAPGEFPEYFEEPHEFGALINDWLAFREIDDEDERMEEEKAAIEEVLAPAR